MGKLKLLYGRDKSSALPGKIKVTDPIILPLKPFEEDASMGGEEGGKNQGLDGHELDEDIQ